MGDKNPKNPPRIKAPTDDSSAIREEGYGYEYDDSLGKEQIKDISYSTKVTLARYMSGLTKGKPPLRQSIDGPSSIQSHPNRYPIPYPDSSYNDQATQFDPTTGYPLPVQTTTDSHAFAPQNAEDPRSRNFTSKTENYAQTINDTGVKIWDGGDRNPVSTVLDGSKVLGAANIRPSPNVTSEFAARADAATKNADVFVGTYQSRILSKNRFTGGITISGARNVKPENLAAERITTYTKGASPSGFSVPDVSKPGTSQKPYVGPTSSSDIFADENRIDLGKLAMVGHTLVARAAGVLHSKDQGYDPTSLKAPFEAAVPNVSQFGIARFNQALFDVRDVINSLPPDVSAVKDPKASGPGGGGSAQPNDPLPDYSTHDSYGAFYSSLYPFSAGSPAELVSNVILVAISQLVELAFVALANNIATRPGDEDSAEYPADRPGEKIVNKKEVYAESARSTSENAVRKNYTLGSYLYNDGTNKLTRGLEIFLGIKPVRNTTFGRALAAGIVAFLGGDIVRVPGTGKDGVKPKFEVNVMSLLSKALTENQQFKIIVLRSIIRSVTELVAKLAGLTPVGAIMLASNAVILEVKNSKIVTLLNTFSQLGDAVYGLPYYAEQEIINAIGDKVVQNVFIPAAKPGDLANLKTTKPDGKVISKMSTSNVAAMLLPPVGNFISPPILTSDKDKFRIATADVLELEKKIPRDFAEFIESQLDSEYVPFYMRDMRTNEVIGFHAFLKTLTDNYTPSYDSPEFYGRGEPVHMYKGSTVRDISLSFVMAAMNPEDFKVMWLKINKLTSLVYPQYSEGRQISLDGNKIIQPFSQVIGASPLIRLRIGDVIRSNYNDASLRSLFGDGTDNFSSPATLQTYKEFFAQNPNIPKPDEESVTAYEQALREKSAEEARDNPNNPDKPTANDRFNEFKKTKETNFFSEESNSIVKSFKENGAGGGLAGFIGNLQFNWFQDNYMWETNDLNGIAGYGTKLGVAPKMVEITMGFKPVHDISPGLNVGGFNRAPIYPLKFMRDKLK